MNEETRLVLNQKGLIPGPHETPEEFERRAVYCLGLRETLAHAHGDVIPSDVMEKENAPPLEEAWEITRPLYDFAPSWAPLFFSNHELAPWHGGCAWIFHMSQDAPMGALFQLRRAFKKRSTFLGIYERSVLLAHESVHVARMAFEEPKFEEILAYRTSESRFQKYIGPLPESSRETSVFSIGCLAGLSPRYRIRRSWELALLGCFIESPSLGNDIICRYEAIFPASTARPLLEKPIRTIHKA